MSDWTEGYVAGVDYTFGYYVELQPLRARLPLVLSALLPPRFETACELGFGQGLSTNIHAAASDVQWFGNDFNPSQAGFAQDLARAAGAGATLTDESFAEFFARRDLPDFDFIGLHGIWSWVSDDNRRLIVDFVRRKLKVGGVLYVSYNTFPGWAQMLPLRHLLSRHTEMLAPAAGGTVSRVDKALEFVGELMALDPLYARAHPLVAERLARMKDMSRQYIAHEYLPRDWQPMHFLETADWLAPAKLGFGCSAHYLDHVDALNLTAAQLDFIKRIPDPMFRQAVRDFMTNTQFRRDYWIKGPRALNGAQQHGALRAIRVVLNAERESITLKAAGGRGEADLNEAIYAPVLDLLGGYAPMSLGELEAAVAGRGVTFSQLLQVVTVLCGKGSMSLVQADEVIASARPASERFNLALMERARGSNEINYLASPVTGAGVFVNRIQQLFLRALRDGRRQPEDWADAVAAGMRQFGERLVVDGKALESDEANRSELLRQARAFQATRLPLLRALQVA